MWRTFARRSRGFAVATIVCAAALVVAAVAASMTVLGLPDVLRGEDEVALSRGAA